MAAQYGSKYLNHSLRSPLPNVVRSIEPFARHLSQAIKKIPAYEGEIYRYTSLSEDQLKVGNKFWDPAFLSASSDPNWRISGRGFGRIFFLIRTRHGHDISCFSAKRDEREVLIERGTRFKIKSQSEFTADLNQTENGPRKFQPPTPEFELEEEVTGL